jgi:hypothetical protein
MASYAGWTRTPAPTVLRRVGSIHDRELDETLLANRNALCSIMRRVNLKGRVT